MNRFCCSNWTTWILAIFSPSLMVLAILLLPPLQVAIAIKTWMMPIGTWQCSGSGAGSETGKQGGHSSQDDLLSLFDWVQTIKSANLCNPCIFTMTSSPLLCRGSLPLVLYYASHLGSNLGPRIWGPWTWGPIAPCNAGPLRPLVL